MLKHSDQSGVANRGLFGLVTFCAALLALPALVNAATVDVTVVSPTLDGTPIDIGYRWVIEEDVTDPPVVDTSDLPPTATPAEIEAAIVSRTHATQLHKSNMPVVASGHVDSSGATTTLPVVLDATKQYYISVLPDQSDDVTDQASALASARDCQLPGNCYTMSGQRILFANDTATSTSTTVVVTEQPLPTAQIFVRAFDDSAPINGVWDDTEVALEGWTVFFYDFTGGPVLTDNYGAPIGTVYDGVNADGTPHLARLGDGTIHTMTAAEAGDPAKNPYGLVPGEALVKNIAPGKYGVQIVPPYGEGWQQSSTIEGTPGLDVWVKAGEPRYFAEFGPAGHHAEFGFVKDMNVDAGHWPAVLGTGAGSITGRITNLRMRRPPDYTFDNGAPLPLCWVGLNDATGTIGLGAKPCNDDSTFDFTGVPDGDYQLVVFDRYLDLIINFVPVTVSGGGATDMGDVETFRWYGSQEHFVFLDENENGWQDPGEAGIPEQAINLRYRDGSFYGTSTTDLDGYLPFDEIFPFFSWLVAEVDFLRFKATGVTIATDAGGPLPPAFPSGTALAQQVGGLDAYRGLAPRMTPQIQDPGETPATTLAGAGADLCGSLPYDPSNTSLTVSGCMTRTELAGAPPLLEGYNAFIGSLDRFWWGKKAWGPGENGGVSGIVHYATTRAENDPRYAAAETWEPGVPRVQINLYRGNAAGVVYHRNSDGSRGALSTGWSGSDPAVVADIDNYPLGWSDGGAMGPEDQNNNLVGDTAGCDATLSCVFDQGDAIDWVHTDSFDDSPPENCPGDREDPFYLGSDAGTPGYGFEGRCYDGLRNFNQVRPAVFDGGFGLGAPWDDVPLDPGFYVVESATPPGYTLLKEEDKNVDFGDTFTLNPLALPPLCVGEGHVVPDQLDLFPGVDSEFAGDTLPLCDRKLVQVTDGKNAAADFFLFTKTPITGHIQGFVLNDLANEFDPNNPNFSEKFAPSYIPVSVRDYAGNEVYHTTTDRYGTYNAIVPSSYRINTPMPSGVSANMLQVCLNSPVMENPGFDVSMPPSMTNQLYVSDPNFNPQFTQFCYTLNFHAGQTTYLDTPVLPIAAFTGPNNYQLDCEYPDATPMIYSASVESNPYGGGPYVAPGATGAQRQIRIASLGNSVTVPDPNAARVDGNNQTFITRDFGFGDNSVDAAPVVTIGDTALTVTSWDANMIVAEIPTTASTGELAVVRNGGAGLRSVNAVTVIIDTGTIPFVENVPAGDKIQPHIDSMPAGGVLLVPPGNYDEMLIVTKPIQLQGWGAPSTIVNATQSPSSKIAEWRVDVNRRMNCLAEIGLLDGQANNTADPTATTTCGFVPGSGLFLNEEGPGVLVAPLDGAFSGLPARIDGFTFTGADQSAGIAVNAYADYLEISNNLVINNQGPYAAGIRVGEPSVLTADGTWADGSNDFINIHHNHVTQNGSLFEVTGAGGGIGLFTGSNHYRVTSNYVCGNNTLADGGGIAHYGLSDDGVIADNDILFNQAFDQTAATGGYGGGIFIGGHEPLAAGATDVGTGSGNVKVLRNRIQGNNAATGDGGGIALRFTNGADVASTSNGNNNTARNQAYSNWFRVDIFNNFIVNNVTGAAGGGISLQDAIRVGIVGNTIVNNDSTATAVQSFGGCPEADAPTSRSCPQPAGVVSRVHSAPLAAAIAAKGPTVQAIALGTTYSRPYMANDIIVGNRSQFWSINDSTVPRTECADPTNGIGCLVVATPAFRDLAVLGTAGSLEPVYSILTTGAAAPAATNQFIAGTLAAGACNSLSLGAEDDLLDCPYRNGPPGFVTIQADGTIIMPETPAGGGTGFVAAAATDEGGNFIDVHYGPLSPAGNYHLETVRTTPAANLAIDTGLVPSFLPPGSNTASAFANRSPDVDRDARPRDGNGVDGAQFDIGGDEYPVGGTGAGANQAPVIINPSNGITLDAYNGVPFYYQVAATDPNGDSLTYSLTRTSGGGATCGVTIDTSTGLITWANPAAGGGGCSGTTLSNFHAIASDGSLSDNNTFSIRRLNQNVPTANPNSYNVNTSGPYVVAAPGVLGNDSNPDAGAGSPGPMTAHLVSNLTAGGSVSLNADGGFTYTPDLTYIGTTSFTYQAVNNVGASANATVNLTRSIAVTDALFTPGGDLNLTGYGVPGDVLTIVSDTYGALCGVGPLPACPVVAGDGTWSLVVTGLAPMSGTTVSITSSTVGMLMGVPVFALDAATAPLSTAFMQCPLDTNHNGVVDAGEGMIDADGNWVQTGTNVVCRHLAAGDGFVVMADGLELYTFGFNDVTNVPANLAIEKGALNAHFPAPTLAFKEGEEVYLSLTNAGTLMRPDLFDPHTVHFHGFPNASTVFDGVPESSIAINQGFTFTYYYNNVEPGTYMYHCHVEAAEHMQMGMLGNLYVRPAQDGMSFDDPTDTETKSYSSFVYNDGDGSTGYDVEKAIQIGSFDSTFHILHLGVQPLPFAEMHDDYPMLNGRGYPDSASLADVPVKSGGDKEGSGVLSASESSQQITARIDANVGDRILLRISDLNVTQFYTLTTTGLKMKVVGTGARILRGPGGANLYYETNSVTLGGGEAADILIDTTGVTAGTYLLYSTNLNELSNGTEDFGGMMTEIVLH